MRKTVVALAWALAVGLLLVPAPARPATAERPNVLFVLTDDQPTSMMSAMPRTKAWLTNSYSNAVAQTPLCCPSRASILSGKFVHNHGVKTLDMAYEMDMRQTFAHRLRAAGYHTAIGGKVMNSWSPKDDASKLGFERWATSGGGYATTPFYSDAATELAPVEDQVRTLGEAARGWLADWESSDDKPWMMYLATTAPHAPYTRSCTSADAPAMPRTTALLDRDLSDKPPHLRDRLMRARLPLSASWRKAWKTLSCVDDLMEQLRDELTRLGELDNTLVIFTSDNGYQFGEHQTYGKREPYEASLRVPFRVSWPAGGAALSRLGRIVGMIDVAPTILDAADVSPGYVVDGRSLLSTRVRKRILIEHFAGGSHAQGVPTWAGYWAPGWMYRRIKAPLRFKFAEKYKGPAQTRNLLGAAGSRADRNWTYKASRCKGSTCRWLETNP